MRETFRKTGRKLQPKRGLNSSGTSKRDTNKAGAAPARWVESTVAGAVGAVRVTEDSRGDDAHPQSPGAGPDDAHPPCDRHRPVRIGGP